MCALPEILSYLQQFLLHLSKLFRFSRIKLMLLLLLFAGAFPSLLFSQSKNRVRLGLPAIHNYTPNLYKASSQNWSVVQDDEGVLYFANHFGVLRFDGSNWQLIAQPQNKTLIRSLARDSNGKIYVGCQNDFGYLKKESNGQIRYISMLPMIQPDDRNFADVWNITISNENVYFHCNDYIFCYNGEKVFSLKAKNTFQFLGNINAMPVALDEGYGLYSISGDNRMLIGGGEKFAPYQIKFVLPFSMGKMLVGTVTEGIFIYDGANMMKWDNPFNDFFVQNRITSGILLQDGHYAIGTIHNGLIIMNAQGEIKYHLNNEKGLQDNLVHFLYEDYQGHIWVSSDNGIDFIEIASPFSYIKGNAGISGSVYSFTAYQNKYLAGSNKGLFSISNRGEAEQIFRITGNLSFPTWSLTVLDDELFIGNQRGTFKLKDNKFNILTDVGGWNFQPLVKNDAFLLVGLYNGLHLFSKDNTGWNYNRRIKGFTESSRVIEQEDDGTIWVAHGYKGVYRIELNPALDKVERVQFFNKDKGFPSNIFISVFKIRGEILFGTEKGVYYYHAPRDTMIPHPFYSRVFGTQEHVRKLAEGPGKEIWFIVGEEYKDKTGILRIHHDESFRLQYTPFQHLQGRHVPGFENFYFSDEEVFIGTKDGIIRFDASMQTNYHEPFSIVLHEVRLSSIDSLIYGTTFPFNRDEGIFLHKASSDPLRIPFSHNALNFSLSAPFFIENEKTRYSFYLEGIDQNWTPWSSNNFKEYTHLPAGSYIFWGRAMNVYGVESHAVSYSFIISPPWYQTLWAYVFFFIVIGGIFLILNMLKNQRFEVEKRKLRKLQVEEMRHQHAEKIRQKLEAENKIIQLKKEKLESEMAANAIHLTQVNEKMISIRTRLMDIHDKATGEAEQQLKTIIAEINHEMENDESWKDFLFYFNRSHQDFLQRLQEQFPELTSVDIKLCAFLRMNLSSKQIASLMNITLRGVEAARLRLRKKMNLDSETNLTEFIVRF
jgi:DNA-binding CsgD family transcriptional regulator